MKPTSRILPRAAATLALAALAFVLTGCVGVVPFPVSTTKVVAGQQLKPQDVAFIQPGLTTRSQVVARLGTDYAALPYQRAIAYSWEMKGGGGGVVGLLVLPRGPARSGRLLARPHGH